MRKNNGFLLIAVPLAVVLFGLVVYDYGYLAVRSEVTEQEKAGWEKKKKLKEYLTLIADRPRIEARLALLRENRKAESAKMIEGQTPFLAAATLQNTVKGIITARGGTISSERIEKPEDAGTFKIITVAVDAVLPDIRSLVDILYATETQTPYLVVRELDTTLRNYQAPKDLMVRLKVSGITGGT
jgi:hypothetical protein